MTGADFMLASTAGNAALISFALYMVVAVADDCARAHVAIITHHRVEVALFV